MASWKDGAFELEPGDSEKPDWTNPMWGGFPNLMDFLAGSFDEKGKCETSPGSLSIWIDQGRLKCCFKLKAESRIGFVVLNDPSNLNIALEKALATGLVDWRKDGVRKRT